MVLLSQNNFKPTTWTLLYEFSKRLEDNKSSKFTSTQLLRLYVEYRKLQFSSLVKQRYKSQYIELFCKIFRNNSNPNKFRILLDAWKFKPDDSTKSLLDAVHFSFRDQINRIYSDITSDFSVLIHPLMTCCMQLVLLVVFALETDIAWKFVILGVLFVTMMCLSLFWSYTKLTQSAKPRSAPCSNLSTTTGGQKRNFDNIRVVNQLEYLSESATSGYHDSLSSTAASLPKLREFLNRLERKQSIEFTSTQLLHLYVEYRKLQFSSLDKQRYKSQYIELFRKIIRNDSNPNKFTILLDAWKFNPDDYTKSLLDAVHFSFRDQINRIYFDITSDICRVSSVVYHNFSVLIHPLMTCCMQLVILVVFALETHIAWKFVILGVLFVTMIFLSLYTKPVISSANRFSPKPKISEGKQVTTNPSTNSKAPSSAHSMYQGIAKIELQWDSIPYNINITNNRDVNMISGRGFHTCTAVYSKLVIIGGDNTVKSNSDVLLFDPGAHHSSSFTLSSFK